MMDSPNERGRRLQSLSRKLRVLHAQLADQPADMRAEQIRDQVQQAIASLQPAEREPFLKDLLVSFPTWSAGEAAAAPAPAPRAPAAPQVPADPKSLADRLVEMAGTMTDAEKREIAQRLRGAFPLPGPVLTAQGGTGAGTGSSGLTAAAAAAMSASPMFSGSGNAAAELRKQTGLPAEAPLDGNRVTELAAILAEFTLRLEPWACSYWRDMAPDAKNQVFPALKTELPKFMLGDEKVPRESVAKSAYRLRSLISLLMKGVTEGGRAYAREHLSVFSVEAIGKAAGSGSLMESKDVKNWKQYVRQMEGVDAQAIEKKLKAMIAKDVDAGLSQVIK
ncbi:MAG: hypothetical protein SFY69_08595 [Planctomycetota bacterium]|nr:hypothetical protein [Planctomycetota bacterium]